ncbi:MAG: malto-oligosyltrehalose synthase [Nitriliruptoraceae bacterium]
MSEHTAASRAPTGIGPPDRPVRATYRLQLHDGFTFADAERVVPRLAALGISHLYLSPALEAVRGSTHGYDVIDPTRIRASLGGEEGLSALADTAHAAGLGLILDIVPNHVGLVSPDNPWWLDVLAHGPDGRYGRHFDVDWMPGAYGQPTLLVPELGERLSEALAGDALQLAHVEDGRAPAWRVVYHDHQWPLAPGTLAAAGFDPDDVEATIRTAGEDRQRLADLLDRQHYRLGYWRRANDELDHRRFFDIDHLGAVRVEDPEVFADVHAAVLPLIADGTLDGLRIDHPDGLADPVGYFERLRAAVGPDAYLVIEKILEHGERFRDAWPVQGTVGYELAAATLGVHLDPAAGPILDDLQATLTGEVLHRSTLHDGAKRDALEALFGAERERLQDRAAAVVTADDEDLAAALTELLVAWPVYRTYLRPGVAVPDPRDLAIVDRAVAQATARRPDLATTLEQLATALIDPDGDATFVTGFQQLTGPAIAKGLEDTVLYRDTRLVAVCEVGMDPTHVGTSIAEFQGLATEVATHRPATMWLSSTHDTKRSEDVRARLAVLSQDPRWWVATALELRSSAAGARSSAGPLPVHEHLAWQTAVGAWPITAERLAAYLVKAAREGKQATDWLSPDSAYEEALERYATVLVTDPALTAALRCAVERVAVPGWITSLAMTLTKLVGPGVPDIYQGTEVWDGSLVDPDNRRPVDHTGLAALTEQVAGREPSPALAAELLADLGDGRAKLWVTRQALRLRRQRPDLLAPGATVRSLTAVGRDADHVVASQRGGGAIAIAPARVAALAGPPEALDLGEATLTLPPGHYLDVLAGRRVDGGGHPVSSLLAGFPVALYVKEG